MAENNPTQEVKEPDNAPWKMPWAEMAKASGNNIPGVTDKPVEAPKKAPKPWEMGWEYLSSLFRKQEPREAPIQPVKDLSEEKFNTVFDALLNQESRKTHLNSRGGLITSSKGAEGISQVMPKTGKIPGYGVTPIQDKSEEEYRRFGRDYLKAMVNEFDGDYEKALAAYNAGVGNVKKAIAKAEKQGADWKEYLPKREETLPYIKKILAGNVVQREIGDRFLSDRNPEYQSLNKPNQQKLEFIDKQANKIEDFRLLQNFLEQSNALPRVEAIYSDSSGEFTSPGIFNDGTVPKEGIIGINLRGFDDRNSNYKVSTYIHEFTHAAYRQIGILRDRLINKKEKLTNSESQFLDTYDKLAKAQKSEDFNSGFSLIAKALNKKWFDKGQDYRSSQGELPAFAVGNQYNNGRSNKAPEHIDTTLSTAFMILLDQASKIIKDK